MSERILQINFSFQGISAGELQQAWLPMAQSIAEVPGLRWKVWLINEDQQACGGIYLFDSDASLQAFLASPIVAATKEAPILSNASVKVFDMMPTHTFTTRGPVGERFAGGNGRPKTFGRMTEEAYRTVPTIKPADALLRQQSEADLLIIDVRDAADVAQTGTVPGAVNLSLGALTYLADHEAPETWRHPALANHSRPIITTCILGPMGALGGKLLHDMGFIDVQILEGGVQGWLDAGLPVAR